jgi:hypothetical protein
MPQVLLIYNSRRRDVKRFTVYLKRFAFTMHILACQAFFPTFGPVPISVEKGMAYSPESH